jgi:hypothetical protein
MSICNFRNTECSVLPSLKFPTSNKMIIVMALSPTYLCAMVWPDDLLEHSSAQLLDADGSLFVLAMRRSCAAIDDEIGSQNSLFEPRFARSLMTKDPSSWNYSRLARSNKCLSLRESSPLQTNMPPLTCCQPAAKAAGVSAFESAPGNSDEAEAHPGHTGRMLEAA